MSDKEIFFNETKNVGRFLGHGIALVAGLLLLIVALGMGVSLVLLPGALIVAVIGFTLIVCGLYAPPPAGRNNDIP